jgi:hypothetical protein
MRQCFVTVQGDSVEPPPVCLYGKNVTNVISKGVPNWELKGQRLKNEKA